MENSKPWYMSKLVWLNAFLFLSGLFDVLAKFFDNGDFSEVGFMLLAGSIVGIVLRIWFTDTAVNR